MSTFLKSFANSEKEVLNFHNVILLAVIPLLTHFEKLLFHLQESGMEVSSVIGIEYSSKKEIHKNLDERFSDVVVPPFEDIRDVVYQKLCKAIDEAKTKGKKIVILENGGYAVPILHERLRQESGLFVGAIEETKQGLWADSELDLLIPIITIADSRFKQTEGIIIGRTVAIALEDQISTIGLTTTGKKICVIGFGIIGSSIANALKGQGAIVMCYDTDAIRTLHAKLEGFETGQKEDLLRRADIIIGSSGKCALRKEDIPILKNNVILASASSKRIEIPIDVISSQSISTEEVSKNISIFRLKNNHSIYLIGGGYPINFLLNNNSCGPAEFFDLIVFDLFMCILELVNKQHVPGIHRPSDDLEQQIVSDYLKLY